ncbi:MAG: aminoacyl-tRNA hydrolase [Rhizobiales bacterium]|nr:aminoacyl-tRNA hydrolase [Hyphomicrobiales bacterium]
MKLIVGLGNPGPKYARNRHNIGFLAVEEIHRANGFSPWRKKFQGEIAEGTIAGARCLLLKPQTYMNESGRSVGEAMRFHKIVPADVIVLHDELDLAPGKLRAKLGGGNAGHNGLRSISAHIGADFWRVRLGIGHPGRKELVQPWVLGDFAKADEVWLTEMLSAIAGAARHLAAGDTNRFMTAVAEATRGEAPQERTEASPAGAGRPAPTSKQATATPALNPRGDAAAGRALPPTAPAPREGPRKWDMVARHTPDGESKAGSDRQGSEPGGAAPAAHEPSPSASPDDGTSDISSTDAPDAGGATTPNPPGSLGDQLRAWLKRGSPKT